MASLTAAVLLWDVEPHESIHRKKVMLNAQLCACARGCRIQCRATSGQKYHITDKQIFLLVNGSQGAPGLDIVNKCGLVMVVSGK